MRIMNVGGVLQDEFPKYDFYTLRRINENWGGGIMDFEWFSTERDEVIAVEMSHLNRIFGINSTGAKFLETGVKGHCAGALFGTNFGVEYADFQTGVFLGGDFSGDNKYHHVHIGDVSKAGMQFNDDNLQMLKRHPYVREVAHIFKTTDLLDNLTLKSIRADLDEKYRRILSEKYAVF